MCLFEPCIDVFHYAFNRSFIVFYVSHSDVKSLMKCMDFSHISNVTQSLVFDEEPNKRSFICVIH